MMTLHSQQVQVLYKSHAHCGGAQQLPKASVCEQAETWCQ